MALEDYVPEDKRAEFQAELAKAFVPLTGLKSHPEFQRQLSIQHETTMANWERDKKPEIIKKEIERMTTKDPLVLRIEELEARDREKDRQILMKERKAQAIAELSKIGLDPELADFVLHEDEAKFGENIAKLTGHVTAWRDEEVKKLKIPAYAQAPKAGESGSVDFSKMNQTEVMQFAKQSPENQAAVTAWLKTRKGA